MPIEIREMIIKARIEPGGGSRPAKPTAKADDCGCKTTLSADDLERLMQDRAER